MPSENSMSYEEYKDRNKEAFDALRDAIGKALYSMTPEERRTLSFMSAYLQDDRDEEESEPRYVPGVHAPTDDDLGRMVFVRNSYKSDWEGPKEFTGFWFVSLYGYKDTTGFGGARYAVLADLEEPAEPDPYRTDPDDLEPGERVMVWQDGDRWLFGPDYFHSMGGGRYFTLMQGDDLNPLRWNHARRATPEELRDAGIEPADGEPGPDLSALTDYEQAALDATPYADLWRVLLDVYYQVSEGKGAERHGGGQAFRDQPMQKLIALYGEGFALGQAAKKMQEAQRMEPEAARRELLGAMAYIAGAVVYRDGEAEE
jgi:hypothetical protein